ncbi:MAG: glutamate--cysteine ligase [Rhodospirillaceae bacterium]|nr:glutamate--cysteine ligase [Rhodospirillaceae bacterium]|tara:strand:+ start:14792 stop:16141 length:1350 start_codon:yes stop_codon:yes gene_type:complete
MADILIEDYYQLADYFQAGCKPISEWKVGTEHEKFGFIKESQKPISYYGDQGILKILNGLVGLGWNPKYENNNIIALSLGKQSITLEPGGQLELSGAPLGSIHETCVEVNSHLSQLRSVSEKIGVGFIGIGFHPVLKLDEVPLMPKSRYKIMKNYMPKKGFHGLDMMFRTCTVQTNLDYSSEIDMVKKLRVSLALQPLSTALFANSPFLEGRLSGYKSLRSYVWMHTDQDRCGMLPFVFEEGMGFESYVNYALDVPMYFVIRDGNFINAEGQTFRDFMKGSLKCLPNEMPLISDWENHLSTLFPEVRLKKFLEMRGADAGNWSSLCANPAFWVGLLYDENCLNEAYELISDFSINEILSMRENVPTHGLKTKIKSKLTMNDLAEKVLKISKKGLKNRKIFDSSGNDESIFLEVIIQRQKECNSPADKLIELFNSEWSESIGKIFEENMA